LLYLEKSSAFTGGAFHFCYFSFGCLHEFHFMKLRKGTSNQIRHPLNLRHIVVKNGLLATIIPFDNYAGPIPFSDGVLIIWISTPAYVVADSEGSGLSPVIRVADYCVAERLSALPIDRRTPQSPPVHFFAKSVGIVLH
jgi:hypothetical protein